MLRLNAGYVYASHAAGRTIFATFYVLLALPVYSLQLVKF